MDLLNSHRKILFVGIGNRLRGDDGAGPVFVERCKQLFPDTPNERGGDACRRWLTLLGSGQSAGQGQARQLQDKVFLDTGESPENYLRKMGASSADAIVFVDAVEMRDKPGMVRFFNQNEIDSGVVNSTFSTHNISLKMLLEFLKDELSAAQRDCEFYLAAIQPKVTGLSESLSDEVSRAVDSLVKEFSGA